MTTAPAREPLAWWRRPRTLLLGVLLAVLTVGWSGLAIDSGAFRHSVSHGLSDEYDEIALNLLEHSSFSANRQHPERATVTRGPVYPLYVAAIYALFGPGRVEVVQASDLLLHALTATLLAAVLFAVAGPLAAVVGGLAYGLWPTTLYYAGRGTAETILLFFLVLTLWFAVRWHGARHWGWMAGAGAAVALGCLSRGSAVVLLGLLALGVLVGWRRSGARTALLALLLAWAAVMAPWWIRNYRVSGAFVPFHTLVWYNAYHDDVFDAAQAWLAQTGRSGVDWGTIPPDSLPATVPRHPQGTAYPAQLSAKEDLAQEARYRGWMLARGIDLSYWSGKALRNARDFWSAGASPRKARQLGLTSVVWGFLALLAFGLAWRERRFRWLLALAAAFTVSTWALYLPFLALFRHSLPTAPFLALTMGLGAAAWWDRRSAD